jgi:hypothetical protein
MVKMDEIMCVKNFIFPNKPVFILAFILSLIVVIQYGFWYAFPPAGMVFTGSYNDVEAGLLSGVRAVSNNFINYWTLDNEPLPKNFIFDVVNYGTVYILVPIGVLSIILLNNILAAYIIAKFSFTFLLIVASYHLFFLITKNGKECNIAFFLYVVSFGFGGLLQFFNNFVFGASIVPDSFFAFGVGIMRVAGTMVALPMALSLISIILVIKNRAAVSAVFAGLAFVAYPSHGIVSFVVILIYLFINSKKLDIVRVVVIMLVFSVFWIVPYLLNPALFSAYLIINVRNSILFLPSVLLGFGIVLLFFIYNFKGLLSTKTGIVFAVILAIAVALTSISFFKDVSTIDPGFGSKLTGLSVFASNYFMPLQAPLVLLTILTIVLVYRKRKNYEASYVFVLLWFLAMAAIIFAPRELTHIFPDKMVYLIYVPVMAMAAKGLAAFSERYKIGVKKILLFVLIISLPGILINLGAQQLQPRVNSYLYETAFYTHDEYDALKFLERQDFGTVIAPQKIAFNVPQIANKKTLILMPAVKEAVYNFENKKIDFETFYATSNDTQRLEITRKYNITYVFSETGNFENSSIMKEIYNKGHITLYKIIA